MNFCNLPQEIIVYIFTHLDVISLIQCTTVNRLVSTLSCDKTIWLNMLLDPRIETPGMLPIFFGIHPKKFIIERLLFSYNGLYACINNFLKNPRINIVKRFILRTIPDRGVFIQFTFGYFEKYTVLTYWNTDVESAAKELHTSTEMVVHYILSDDLKKGEPWLLDYSSLARETRREDTIRYVCRYKYLRIDYTTGGFDFIIDTVRRAIEENYLFRLIRYGES